MKIRGTFFSLLFVIFISQLPSFSNAQIANQMNLGIHVCGAEFGEKQLPGTLGKDYIFPTIDQLTYFAKKGFKTAILPIKWERIQPKLGLELDSPYVLLIRKFLVDCKSVKINSVITMQNFAKYNHNNQDLQLGSKQLPIHYFKDVWGKIAATFSNDNSVWGYDIMNEPRGIFGRDWFSAAQNAIDAIRVHDTIVHIIVDGENGSFSYNWKYDNDKLKYLTDVANKIIFDAHCYFDYDYSGRYDSTYKRNIDVNVGVKYAKPFIDWLKKNKKKGIIGEFGVPANNEKWFEAMRKFLDYLKLEGIEANYWAAGLWWGKYALSIEPENGEDKPQMKVLSNYLPLPSP